MRTARDLQVRSADRLGERGSLGEVPLCVGESPRPRLDDPEIQERDSRSSLPIPVSSLESSAIDASSRFTCSITSLN